MLIRIDLGAAAPIYEQIAGQVRRAIADGRARVGEQLPAARELSESLGVNMHTVLRAYALLRDEGVIDMHRRRGAVVRGAAGGRARLLELVRELRDEAARQGLSPKELSRFMKEVT